MSNPSKHTLLSIIGTSPAVITETLYGINQEGMDWPDEIIVITTLKGKAGVLDHFFTRSPSPIVSLCSEIGQPVPYFPPERILVVPDAQGNQVEDARSLEDHEALADFIVEQVRKLTSRPNETLHASLAGGRKTMTYYLGNAMTLFGRRHDVLSHVLVSEGYESLPGFYYPTQGQHLLEKGGKTYDTSKAEVILADIPFLRLRDGLPPSCESLGDSVSFRELVKLTNLSLEKDAFYISLDCRNSSLTIYNSNDDQSEPAYKPILLSFLNFAFLLLLAEATLDNSKKYRRPTKDEPLLELGKHYLKCFLKIHGLEVAQDLHLDELLELAMDHGLDPRTQKTLEESDGMSQQFYSDKRTKTRNELLDVLPEILVNKLIPRYSPKGSPISMDLAPSQVSIQYGNAILRGAT